MRTRLIIRLPWVLIPLCACFLLSSCVKDDLEDQEDLVTSPNATVKSPHQEKIRDHYIVVLSEKSVREDPRAANALEALTKEVRQDSRAKVKYTYKNVFTGFAARLTQEQLQRFKSDPRIKKIEQDAYLYPVTDVVVQEYVTWGLDRTDQRGATLDRAYSYTATGSGVTAYIIDSGIRYSHSEFGSRASLGYDFVLEEDPENTDPNQEAGDDCLGHGTHVAGTVGGNTMGVAKDVDLVSVRVFGCSPGTPRSRTIAAVDWVTQDVQNNRGLPAVVNMSLGGASDPEQSSLHLAIQGSTAAGISYVVAAGNAGGDACGFEPARFDEVLTVAASEIGDHRANFSNYGECVDIFAPGRDITSASIVDDHSFREYSGTSMSAPHVAGLAALYLQNNPEAAPAAVLSAIIENATPNAVAGVPSGTNALAYSHWSPVAFTPPTPPPFNLKATSYKQKGATIIELTWDPTDDAFVEIYRGGKFLADWYNDGYYKLETKGKGNEVFQVCEIHYEHCSEEVVAIEGEEEYVPNIRPVAEFSYVVNDLEVTFTDESYDEDGEIMGWTWWFGDGYYSTTQNPRYRYKEPGTYRVELQVSDNLHENDYIIKYISVGTEEPLPEGISLNVTGYKEKGRWKADLSWIPEEITGKVDIYRNGGFLRSVENTGSYTDNTGFTGSGSLMYKICQGESSLNCSEEVTVDF